MNEQIAEILANFDFDRVKKVMTILDWKWGVGINAHIPTYNELRQTAKELLESTYLDGRSASGGLEAEMSDGIVRLVFIVSEYEVEEE